MWLLDHNLPQQLVISLKSVGIDAHTTVSRGWEKLENDNLVSAAGNAGFLCILTRDSLFEETARRKIRKFPQMAIILLTITQQEGNKYAKEFLKHWKKSTIVPIPQKMLHWPNI
ncbi:MAG: DUF5615 family PIN-like protein [Halobacteriovoraceae bacterium]|nr:DUF5615 family PIN-like protein [Halobacteriovoraceae bacterium]